MSKVVGGMFGFSHFPTGNIGNGKRDFLNDKNLRLINARSGISLLLDYLSTSRLWLPSYLCPSILQGVNRNVVEVFFYPVSRDLGLVELGWLSHVRDGDLVVMIDYFGFPTSDEVSRCVKNCGAWILEDASQALLSTKRLPLADFVLVSPRKFVGVPDGGILMCKGNADLPRYSLRQPSSDWWLGNFHAMVLRTQFDGSGVDNCWFDVYAKIKDLAPCGPFSMSQLTAALLETSFDYDAIARARIENFRVLLAALEPVSIFKSLPEGVVPLGFPVRLPRRKDSLIELYADHIYPPIHWDLGNSVPAMFNDSHELSNEALTIPCDQRYHAGTMGRIANILSKFIS